MTIALLSRPRLLRRIETPVLAPITVIIAPAGFGKSTLAEQWARAAAHPVAWLPLGPECNNPSCLLTCLLSALDQVGGAPDETPPATVEHVIARLQELAAEHGEVTLIVDDYHLIENPDVHQMMDALLDSLTPRMHLILLSRTVPPLALGRRRAYGQVRELTDADLSFTADEIAAVIPRAVGERLGPAQVDLLAERTEGWIAAIRLALAFFDHHAGDRVEESIGTFADNPWLDQFLTEEVFDALPDELREFMLRSSVLPYLEPALCDAVLEINTSTLRLRELARHVVFVRRRMDHDELVYHALFAECVQRIAADRLPLDERMAMHRRAAAWFDQQGCLELALEQALKGDDLVAAVGIARNLCRPLNDADRRDSILHWLRMLPLSSVLSCPDLAYWYIASLLRNGETREALPLLARVESAWLASGDPVQLGYASICQAIAAAHAGETDRTLQLGYQILDLLPTSHVVERLRAWSAIALYEGFRGNDEQAHHAYREAERCMAYLPHDQAYWHLHTVFERSNLSALRGDLTTAGASYQHALDLLPGSLRAHEPKYRYRLAALYLEQNDLVQASREEEYVRQAMETMPAQYWHAEALVLSARLQRARGDHERANDTLNQALTMAELHGIRNALFRAEALRAAWWLEENQPGLARRWEERVDPNAHRWVNAFGDINTWSTIIHLRVAEGAYAQASGIARERIAEAESTRRWAESVMFLAWDVVAQLGLGDESAALKALGEALRLGGPGGFVRSFFPPGMDLVPFFQGALHQLPASEAAYMTDVLKRMHIEPLAAVREAAREQFPSTRETLTGREQEVLHWLRDGYSNREIAERLFITERTVKKHVGNILAKLGAANRTAAVVQSRRLGLLD